VHVHLFDSRFVYQSIMPFLNSKHLEASSCVNTHLFGYGYVQERTRT